MESRLDETRDMKSTIQEIRLELEDSLKDVEKSSTELELRMRCYDNPIEKLESRLKSLKKQDEDEIEQREYEEELSKMKLRYEEEKKIEEMKLYLQSKNERKTSDKELSSIIVKPPRLVITKFEDTHLDWLRFWSQYNTEIDKSSLSVVGTFFYLKELLNPKVRALVDGVLFTTEVCERAKNILVIKFDKQNEVVNVHIHSVMNLPTLKIINWKRSTKFMRN